MHTHRLQNAVCLIFSNRIEQCSDNGLCALCFGKIYISNYWLSFVCAVFVAEYFDFFLFFCYKYFILKWSPNTHITLYMHSCIFCGVYRKTVRSWLFVSNALIQYSPIAASGRSHTNGCMLGTGIYPTQRHSAVFTYPLYSIYFNNLNIFSLIFSKNIIMLISVGVCAIVWCVCVVDGKASISHMPGWLVWVLQWIAAELSLSLTHSFSACAKCEGHYM